MTEITAATDLSGLGARRVAGEGAWGAPSGRPHAVRVLRRAVELGVDVIDTADALDLLLLHRVGPGLPAEEQLGTPRELQDEGTVGAPRPSEPPVEHLAENRGAAGLQLDDVTCEQLTAAGRATPSPRPTAPTPHPRRNPSWLVF